MGYSTRNNGQIKTFWPDDTDQKFYIASIVGATLAEYLSIAKEKWPDATLNSISILAERIHTDRLMREAYDSGDYMNFIVMTKLY